MLILHLVKLFQMSDVPVNNIDIDYFTKRIASKYNLSPVMDKEIIDKFIAYEHLTSINADSVTISKLGIMSNSELFSKYSFLNESVSQSILDEFRVGEYRLKTTGVDTLTSKNLYFDNSGLLVSIEKKCLILYSKQQLEICDNSDLMQKCRNSSQTLTLKNYLNWKSFSFAN